LLLAGHDRSDGGLATTLLEMAFAGNCGLDVDLSPAAPLGEEVAGAAVAPCLAALFNEEVKRGFGCRALSQSVHIVMRAFYFFVLSLPLYVLRACTMRFEFPFSSCFFSYHLKIVFVA
jgi:hypothetical protein